MIRVKNTETGEYGFVIKDTFGCCDYSEDLVVYDGTNTGLGTDRTLLKRLKFAPPTPNFVGCGVGRVEECCIFLTAGSEGVRCERFTPLRDQLIFRTMNAKRNPKEPYPECMVFLPRED